jgi:hypothetical protein
MKLSSKYVAGFLDGEGYVSARSFTIEIFNTHVGILRRIRARFGIGKIKLRGKDASRLGRKKQYKLQICGRLQVQKFLKPILPFVIVKRKRCAILATALTQKEVRKRNGHRRA